MFGIGPPELIIIMVVALIVFGPERLPQIASQIGKAVRDFRQMSSDLTGEFNRTINAADLSPSSQPVPYTSETAGTVVTDRQTDTGSVAAPDQAPGDEALRLAEEHAATVAAHSYEEAAETNPAVEVPAAPTSNAAVAADAAQDGDKGSSAPSDVFVFRPANSPVHVGKPALFAATPTAFGGAALEPGPAANPSAVEVSERIVGSNDAADAADNATVWHWRPAAPPGTAVANSSRVDPHAG